MKITTEPRKLALAMLNEMHATMGTELVYKTKFEKLAVDKIAEKHIAAALEAQAKQIEEKKTLANAWHDAYEMRRIESEEKTKQIEHWKAARESAMFAGEQMLEKIKEQAKQIEALQADAERYRVGREAAFAGLLVDFPHTKTWSDAMDFAYDQMIAARKRNV